MAPRCIFVASLILLAAGCAGQQAIRQRRDAALLQRDDVPSRPMRSLDLPPPAVLVPETLQVFANPAENRDGALSLADALTEGLRSSQVVRVVDGGTVEAGQLTQYDVDTFRARADAALAAFDTTFSAGILATRFRQPPSAFFGPGLAEPLLRDQLIYGGGFTKPLTTGGKLTLFYDPEPSYLYLPQGNGSGFNPSHVGAVTLGLRQPLLNGAGVEVNSVPIQVAQIRYEQSAWEFKKEVMRTVRGIVEAYWDLHAARVALQSINDVLPLLEETVDLNEKAFRAERAIFADVAKATGQLHAFRQERAELLSRVMANELRLRNLMGLPPADGWNLIPATPPTTRLLDIDTHQSLQVALLNQPDLVRQRLNVAIREKEMIVAQNGLQPRLDFEALYRMNGVGEDLGSTLAQLATANYSDWQVGATFSVPLGRRQAAANLRAAELQFARERALLEQARFTTAHQLGDVLRQIYQSYDQYHEATLRLQSADQWLQGARVRYKNPLPAADGQNWLLQYLNDYLAAVRFRTDSATEVAALLADYNDQLVKLEEVQGTLLSHFAIDLVLDPCVQAQQIPSLLFSQNSEPPAAAREEALPSAEVLPPGPAPQPRPASLPAPIAPPAEILRLPEPDAAPDDLFRLPSVN